MRARLTAAAVAPLAVFADRLAAGRLLAAGDGFVYYLPLHVLAGRALRHGHLPVWNPYSFGGMPLLAANQVAAFYPPNLAFAVASPALANNLVVLVDFVVVAAGTFLLARRLTGDGWGALVAAVSFSLGGFMVGQIVHQSIIASASWLPWTLLALDHLVARFSVGRLALAGASVALVLVAGHSQLFCFTVLVLAIYAAVWSIMARRRVGIRPVVAVAAMTAVGLGLAAIQLVPTVAILDQTDRSGLSYDEATSFSYPT